MTKKQYHRFYLKEYSQKTASELSGGVFVECGVKYGTSSIIMAKTLNRNGFLFDTWGKFSGISSEDGPKSRIIKIQKRKSSHIKSMCREALIKNNVNHLCRMIRGDVIKTLPEFLKIKPDIVMVHLDMDIYNPTRFCLFSLWRFLRPGGCIFMHDYGDKKWKGIKKSVEEFMPTVSTANLFVFDSFCGCVVIKETI